MRVVPFRHRFACAARLARTLALPLRATRMFSSMRRGLRLNSEKDISLHLLLRCMSASGTGFDVPLALEGEALLREALDSGRGTVIVGPHSLLSRLLLRRLYDLGHWPTIIGAMDGIPVAGTREVMPTLFPDAGVLLLARRRLAQGGIVCANVDQLRAQARKNTIAFASPVGEIRVSDAIFRLAVRCQAPVLFTYARAEGAGVRQWIAAPDGASAQSPEAMAADFIRFVQERTDYLG
jgi:lauroyl/myristoyl acyltransferase